MTIYLNNASTTWPKPPCVAQAMSDFLTHGGANLARGAASQRDLATLDSVYECRRALAELLGGYGGGNPQYVTFTANVTEAINIVLKGFLRPGMRVLTTSMEHNSVIRPLRSLEESGVRVQIVRCERNGLLGMNTFTEALAEGADLVVMTHASNVCGTVQDVGEIAARCAARHIPLVLDCAQTAGTLSLSAKELGLAALCFTGHKGLLGPQGTGGIVWNPDFAERCAPFVEGGTGSLSHEQRQPKILPDKFEAGTPNLPGIAGLHAAVEWLTQTGVRTVHEREKNLGIQLMEGLKRISGLTLYGTHDLEHHLPVLAFNIEGVDNARLALALSEGAGIETRPGLHCSPLGHETLGSFPQGALRLSPGYFNTPQEIDDAIHAIAHATANL